MFNQPIVPKEKESAISDSIAKTQEIVSSIIVEDQAGVQMASELLGKIKANLNSLKMLKDQFVKPYEDEVKKSKNWFKMQEEPFKQMEVVVKDKIGVYMEDERKKAEEAAKKAAEEATKNNEENKPVPIEVPKMSVQATSGKVSAKEITSYEIVDESKIPREYLTVDRGAIQKAVRDGVKDIPGVKIIKKTSVAFRV